MRAYFLHATVATEAVRGLLGRRRIRAFTLERVVDITESGASVWQEAAVLDGRRLILWHSEDLADESPGQPLLDSSIQVVPLDSVVHLGMRTLVGTDAHGNPVNRAAYLVVGTSSPHELATVPTGEETPPSARFRQEAYRFSKTVEEDGAGQVARLIAFGRACGRLMPRG